MQLTLGLLLSLAEGINISFLFAIHRQSGLKIHCSTFVHIFIFSFSIGLTLWAERYKIPAQQQALP
jgi:hypothetical protein